MFIIVTNMDHLVMLGEFIVLNVFFYSLALPVDGK